MKEKFFEYYQPTDDEFKLMWKECLFVLDANVLLNLYRYSNETSNTLLEIFKNISDRLWIPHQVAYEYHKNRLTVISDQTKAFEGIENSLNSCKDNILKDLNTYKKDSILKITKLNDLITMGFSSIFDQLLICKDEMPNYFTKDVILNTLTSLFETKVSEPYIDEKLKEIYTEGGRRYDALIPPGFSDKDKPEPDRYGDLIVWFQIIDKAISTKTPIIFITDDRKKDWWHIFEGKTIGPKRELIREIFEKAKTRFYMYNSDSFIRFYKEFNDNSINESTIEEVEHVRKNDEEKIREDKLINHNHINNYLYKFYNDSKFTNFKIKEYNSDEFLKSYFSNEKVLRNYFENNEQKFSEERLNNMIKDSFLKKQIELYINELCSIDEKIASIQADEDLESSETKFKLLELHSQNHKLNGEITKIKKLLSDFNDSKDS